MSKSEKKRVKQELSQGRLRHTNEVNVSRQRRSDPIATLLNIEYMWLAGWLAVYL